MCDVNDSERRTFLVLVWVVVGRSTARFSGVTQWDATPAGMVGKPERVVVERLRRDPRELEREEGGPRTTASSEPGVLGVLGMSASPRGRRPGVEGGVREAQRSYA